MIVFCQELREFNTSGVILLRGINFFNARETMMHNCAQSNLKEKKKNNAGNVELLLRYAVHILTVKLYLLKNTLPY